MRRRVLHSGLRLWVDPQAAFVALHGRDENCFWLDCGIDASEGVSAMGAAASVMVDKSGARVLDVLREGLRDHEDVVVEGAGFRLGWVGWLGYELRSHTMCEAHGRSSKHPNAAMMWVDRAVVFDHSAGTVSLLALGTEWSGELLVWRDATAAALLTVATSDAPQPTPSQTSVTGQASVTWAHREEQYLEMIAECQRAIRNGDAYQLCLTTAAHVDSPPDPLQAYLALRRSSPAHHGGFLRVADVSVLSSSPEQFLAVDPDGAILTRPIKGTRPRAADQENDLALARELRESEKEQAENLMIVDLMRNDFTRVCDVGSVEVTSLLAVETYPHVHQLVSTVRGRLRPGLNAIDAIEACFPAGSMTGAPKREATRILDRLEGRARGIYSGAFGHLGLDGRLDLGMVIRTIVIDGEGATVGAGGGITVLSDPAEELAEVRLKAAALLRVLVGEPDRRDDAGSGSAEHRVSA
ncbi:aminodeoxychorismate synthase component I [Salinibacterium sp. SYSU T00001]|uniref:aminodeoxychorismate synthase component I n=1 Tax=Homoserinimonas sedimenticola TaxID=2986805 RepID=UPI0022366A26|nr:aminodeoxychorismate synthase component I [Salinibacterium sedimenticola]MCW4384610.1 aminodeoxychorismate synthase component I [Salinibacterium sedimenticola]